MLIGVMQVRLHLPNSGSLKGKRRILKSLKDRLKNKFNVSVAELENQDIWQSSTIGMAIISNDKQFANSVLSKAADLVNNQPDIIVTDIQMEWL
ncbi:MAG: DUF503 domain-containing protein [candidate division Zixibacteria bacterium]|nr:DUF503 domain-containing protein [candidate division Zixibacteria bacterium]